MDRIGSRCAAARASRSSRAGVRTRATARLVWALLAATGLFAAPCHAQSEAGTVAAVIGTLQVERNGAWQEATVGAPVFVGDRLRTGPTDRAKIVFADDSVLALGGGTEVLVDTQLFSRPARRFHTLLRLTTGKIRAWVSDYYREPRARYEVETPTAIAGVRGTEFIAVYTPADELTEVIGIVDQVDVNGKLPVVGPGVQIGPEFYTQVAKGRFPTPPERLDAVRFRQFLQEVEIVGTGRRDGLEVLHPAVQGQLLATQDVPWAVVPPPAAVTGLQVGAPQPFLAAVLSQDIAANTQPLLDFERMPPGQTTGGVRVGFGF